MTIYTLYVKIHKVTGLKYFGYTKCNPFHYKGSGTNWKKHLEEYGDDIDTEIILSSENLNEIKLQGRYFSELWNIVESPTWANLKPETGMGGGAGPEGSKKISQALTGKPKSAKHIENLKGKNLGKRYSPEINRKKARPGKLNGIYGIKRPEIMAIANAASVAKSKGKTYEEIYGAEKAQELKKIKSIKLKEYLKNNPNSRLKYYKIISPEGTIYTIVGNLEKFCKEHKIYSGKMYDVLKGRLESYNGWKVSVV